MKEKKKNNMPERSCICCRKKGEKSFFFRISHLNDKYVFDEQMKIQSRGFYVCKNSNCIEKLSKHKKYNIEIETLIKMLNELKKEKKYIIDIIRAMKNSKYFIFGIDENIEAIKKNKVKMIILPKDIKEKYKREFLKLLDTYKLNILFIEKKEEFVNIFSRDVNVIGVFDKSVVNGILNKVEVTNEDIRTS